MCMCMLVLVGEAGHGGILVGCGWCTGRGWFWFGIGEEGDEGW